MRRVIKADAIHGIDSRQKEVMDGVPKAKGIGLAEGPVPFLELSEEARERKAFPPPNRLHALS